MSNKPTDGPDMKDWDWEDFERWRRQKKLLEEGPDSKKSPIHNFKRRR